MAPAFCPAPRMQPGSKPLLNGRKCATVATCTLNQLAMDFDANLDRSIRSMEESKAAGARYRLGPELELSGYMCEDHFLEADTANHCCESLAVILSGSLTHGMLCDVGLPFVHQGVFYNCRALLLGGHVLLLRPKCTLADDLNYRESRWFTAWPRQKLTSTRLPAVLQQVTGQETVPFGDAMLDFADTTVGIEMCEELWSPSPVHLAQFLEGAELVTNASASHHEVGKQRHRLQMLEWATHQGGVYMYSNQIGCDGGRLYFDGGSMIVEGGALLAMGQQYAMRDIEVVTATVNLRRVEALRTAHAAAARTQANQANGRGSYPRIQARHFFLATSAATPTTHIRWEEPSREEQMANACALWIWDQLRRTVHRCGFFLATSGGADSSVVATLVSLMCRKLVNTAKGAQGEAAASLAKSELRRIIVADECGEVDFTDHRAICNRIFHTAFMRTRLNCDDTHRRAVSLSEQIGAHFHVVEMDNAADALDQTFQTTTGVLPKYGAHGGTHHENNMRSQIRGRLRLVTSYMHATAGPLARGHYGTLLVLGSANSDEHNRGYNDRYDCSSADINAIASISKADVNNLLRWGAAQFDMPELAETAAATPLSETEPEDAETNDEADMGMSYHDLSVLSHLRKANKCGPVSMFQRLVEDPPETWQARDPAEIARKVKLYFFYYALHRHLMTTMPPSLHTAEHNPDDNRHDLRQFVYNCRWPRQFRMIDAELAQQGISAALPQTQQPDGSMTVPSTMSGHFTYPRRSNVEIGHRWAALPDVPALYPFPSAADLGEQTLPSEKPLAAMLLKLLPEQVASEARGKLEAVGLHSVSAVQRVMRGEHEEFEDLRDALPGRSNAALRELCVQHLAGPKISEVFLSNGGAKIPEAAVSNGH